jgi:hypothetical protein
MPIFRAKWALFAGKANHENAVSRDKPAQSAIVLPTATAWFPF